MSTALIRTSFENALAAMPGALSFAKQNKAFKSTVGIPYAEVHMLMSEPQGNVLGGNFKREVGALQVTFCFPANTGTEAIEAKAEQLRLRFKRGTTLNANGIRVLVQNHPYMGPGMPDGGWYRLPVRVPFIADVFGVA